jgi:hypothetical protein
MKKIVNCSSSAKRSGLLTIALLASCASESQDLSDGVVDIAPISAQVGEGVTAADVACNPANRGAAPKAITGLGKGVKPAGEFEVVVEDDPTIPDQTIFRPEPLGKIKHPVLAWGNGACMKSNGGFTEFLMQLAAQGIVVVADGKPRGSGSSAQNGAQLLKGIDWAEKENERPCSQYYHKLDIKKIAVSGQSCGGLMALNVSGDKRITTSMPMNSGLMSRNQTLYRSLHAPMAFFNGGSSDIAFANGNADFQAINNIPVMNANFPVGHMGTYNQDNGGEMGKAATGWLRWHLLGDQGATGKGMFVGSSCGLCNSKWDIKWKMEPK